MLHLLHRFLYVCTVQLHIVYDKLHWRAGGVTFLEPGSNSTRPPPRGGVISYIYHDAPPVSVLELMSLVIVSQSAYSVVCS